MKTLITLCFIAVGFVGFGAVSADAQETTTQQTTTTTTTASHHHHHHRHHHHHHVDNQ